MTQYGSAVHVGIAIGVPLFYHTLGNSNFHFQFINLLEVHFPYECGLT